MDDAKELWAWWQSLLGEFRTVFTLGGWARFAHWVTGTVLCAEEHTITQILSSLGLESQWHNAEYFAEYGSWDREAVERQLMRVVEREHPARWGGYHPVAIDDTKEHRTSGDVWGNLHLPRIQRSQPQPGDHGASAQLGRDGQSGARQALDLAAVGGAVVFSQKPTPGRRIVSQLLAALNDLKKPPQTKFHTGRQTARAA